MHYEYCTSSQFERLNAGEIITLAYPNTAYFEASQLIVLSEYLEQDAERKTRLMTARITSIKKEQVPDGYVGLELRKVW